MSSRSTWRSRRALAVKASVLAAVCVLVASSSSAQDRERFALEIEGDAVWQSRNDVRIPNDDSATKFSLVDAVGSGAYGAFRVEAAFDVAERHGFRVVFAPLQIQDMGVLESPVSFAGEDFEPGAVDATYKFSSYRFTYRYRFFNGDRWRWKIGFTGFVRDARIALEQGERASEDTDVGFVPLVHLQGRAKLGAHWQFLLDFDGLGSTQGRAFDVSTRLVREIDEHWSVAFGYRTIEGGADVDSVFNFAWLNFATASVRYSF